MGQYNTAIVTQQGQQILAEAVGAQQVITFTSVKTSSHSYSSETDLTTLTGLQDIMQSVSPSSAAVTNGNIVEVTARFDNAGVQNEYQIQTIGLYGKTQNGEETLIAVVKAVTPDTMPDSAYSPIAYIYNIQLTIQSGESVAVTVNPAGTATVQDVLELRQTIATLQQNVNEQIAQLNSDMSKIVFGTYTGKPEDGIIEIPAPGIQPNSAIAVNGDYAAANSTYVLGVRTPSDNNVLQVMVEGTSGTMRINYIYKKS